jgi:hypothetical protein
VFHLPWTSHDAQGTHALIVLFSAVQWSRERDMRQTVGHSRCAIQWQQRCSGTALRGHFIVSADFTATAQFLPSCQGSGWRTMLPTLLAGVCFFLWVRFTSPGPSVSMARTLGMCHHWYC